MFLLYVDGDAFLGRNTFGQLKIVYYELPDAIEMPRAFSLGLASWSDVSCVYWKPEGIRKWISSNAASSRVISDLASDRAISRYGTAKHYDADVANVAE